jgi:hypothetical protein
LFNPYQLTTHGGPPSRSDPASTARE